MFLISVVAEILSVHPQTLRLYEREGFVRPRRTGNQRLYSRSDVERLGLVVELSRDLGVNRAGVEIILRMRRKLKSLQGEVDQMMESLDAETRARFSEKFRQLFNEEDDDERR